MACAGGSTVCTGAVVTNGNSGNGPAPAGWENVTIPAIAPTATATRREFALKISRLNIVVPLLDCLSAQVRLSGASLGQAISGNGFRTVASEALNGFVGRRINSSRRACGLLQRPPG